MNPKKQQIINAAHHLFIKKGYNASSIQDILDEAGISKGTFYNYFTSKSECLIALMESIAEDIRSARISVAFGESPSDPDLFAKQLAIRMRMNHEKNLFSLYESIFYSQDEELKAFGKSQYILELKWLSSRIIDLFGEKVRPYALENAAIANGALQQLMHVWRFGTEQQLPLDELTDYIVHRMKQAVEIQLKDGKQFLSEGLLGQPQQPPALSDSVPQLQAFAEQAENDDVKQLLTFLADELTAEHPRNAVLSSVLTSLGQTTESEAGLQRLLEQLWRQIK
ncbi:TetR/AcrR family transcriptional regulator [Planococcus maritimus]|uniref:TetR/AcrR family transcriptional regulator n=1 Tax=Planococcus maritimus TaxID=192421 RepID=A0A7D7R1Z7_PLAMR|nr:TetR/AcrR family transcriptional regulator [Planococcus maritimus]QMT18336.1 TetR/AcrR family transcriptional regulator [Planococcus maritimus]